MQGTMLWFNGVKDLGFILTEEGERLSVFGSGFAGGKKPEERCARAPVTFEIKNGEGGRRAEEVVFVAQVAARRARLRHRGARG